MAAFPEPPDPVTATARVYVLPRLSVGAVMVASDPTATQRRLPAVLLVENLTEGLVPPVAKPLLLCTTVAVCARVKQGHTNNNNATIRIDIFPEKRRTGEPPGIKPQSFSKAVVP